MVLQLANSPFYRRADEIVSLRSAITRIGLEEAINSVNLYFLQWFLPNLSELHGIGKLILAIHHSKAFFYASKKP